MDPLLAARDLPLFAARSMRAAIIGALDRPPMTPRALVDDALVRFERAVEARGATAVRPALLFSERDRIVRELRRFVEGRFAARLGALRRRDVVAVGRSAAPFDAIVRNQSGHLYALVLRRLPLDGRRLDRLRRIASIAVGYKKTPLRGVIVFDFTSGSARLVRDPRIITRVA